MSVEINGLSKLNGNDYDKIVISQVNNGYKVEIIGNGSRHFVIPSENKISDELGLMDDTGKIMAIVGNYLNYAKINKITDLAQISFHSGLFKAALGNRMLAIQLFGPELENVSKMMVDKYEQDRYDFCYGNSDAKWFRINLSTYCSSYGVCYDSLYDSDDSENEHVICLDLRINKDGYLESREYEFISELMISTFSKVNKEVEVIKVFCNEYGFSELVGYELKCGDIRMYFPREYSLSWIFNVIQEYNRELSMTREDVKKRQLRMEGF